MGLRCLVALQPFLNIAGLQSRVELFTAIELHLSTSPLIFSFLSPYVFSAIIPIHFPEHRFFFHPWTHIPVMQKCLNFYELYLIWLNTTQVSFGSLLFPLYFPNKMEWNFLTAVADFPVWLFWALLPNHYIVEHSPRHSNGAVLT